MKGGTSGRLTAWLWLAYLSFVVYGSLVPFHFRALSLNQTVVLWRETEFLSLSIQSRADLVANFLLFIPLAYLSMALLLRYRQDHTARLLSAGMVACCGVALAFAIEFAQLFFPGRTVSYNDVLMESLGGLAGVCVFLLWHSRVQTLLASLIGAHASHRQANAWVLAYLLWLAVFSFLPLDLTLSPADLYSKWREGRIILWPQGAQPFYDQLLDALLMLPLGVFWWTSRALSSQPPRWVALLRFGLVVCLLIEAMQLFVWSRVTDLGDILRGTAGVMLGAWLAQQRQPLLRALKNPVLALSGAFVALLALLWMHWYPFDFRSYPQNPMAILPFDNYYHTSEYHAFTEATRKLLYFLPFGFFVGRLFGQGGWSWLILWCTAWLLEWGEIWLPGRWPDLTDVFFGVAGGLLGLWFWRRLTQSSPWRELAHD